MDQSFSAACLAAHRRDDRPYLPVYQAVPTCLYTVSYLRELETATHGSLETCAHNGSLITTVPIVRCLIQPSRHILITHSQRWGLMKPQTGG